jgi:transcriptional activator HAC1
MEASQHNDLQIIQSYVQGTTTEGSPSKTVKMEDVTSSAASSQSLLEVPVAGSTPKAADSKPVKKRKSWGQVLPEPKTNLAPRKVNTH